MKKKLVSMFLLVFSLCLIGCGKNITLSSITKNEDFTTAYISSNNGDEHIISINFDDLKEKYFYKDIMASITKPIDVLPDEIPTYSLIIESDDNILHIDCRSDLYAQYNEKWYLVKCSKEDLNALEVYLDSNEEVPTNHFLRNQLGCEWLNEIKVDDIIEIKIISESIGVAPGTFKNITTSTNKTVISKIFEKWYWLDTAPIIEGQTPGGNATSINFIFDDGIVKEICINNGKYIDTNGNYFELLYIPKFDENDEYESRYSFITYQDTFELYTIDGVKLGEYSGLSEYEFVEYSYDKTETNEDLGYLETEFGRIYIHSDDVFYIKEENVDKYFLIKCEKDFYNLFFVDDNN